MNQSILTLIIAVLCATVPLAYAHGHEQLEIDNQESAVHTHHDQIELDDNEVPMLDLGLEETDAGGFALKIKTSRFRFTKEHADGPHVPGEGHAHLYIDGRKIGRIYSEHYEMDPLSPGVHEIKIMLFSNDHRGYATAGVGVGQRYIVLEPDSRPAPARIVKVSLPVGGSLKRTDRTIKVKRNERVELQLSTDYSKTLHLHGYDVEVVVTPESPVTLYLIATIAGRFAIEEHGESARHHAATAYLEVHPD